MPQVASAAWEVRVRRWGAALLVLVFGAARAGAIAGLDVPLDHWAYEFLERIEVRAGLQAGSLEVRPRTRGETAKLVAEAATRARDGAWRPTPIEARQLDMLRHEFADELAVYGDTLAVLDRAYHLWGGDRWRLQAFARG